MAMVSIPAVLRQDVDGQSLVEVGGSTIGNVLRNLEVLFPGLKGRIIVDGRLSRHLNVYLNNEDVRYLHKKSALNVTVPFEAEILLIPQAAGG